ELQQQGGEGVILRPHPGEPATPHRELPPPQAEPDQVDQGPVEGETVGQPVDEPGVVEGVEGTLQVGREEPGAVVGGSEGLQGRRQGGGEGGEGGGGKGGGPGAPPPGPGSGAAPRPPPRSPRGWGGGGWPRRTPS